MNIFGWHDYFGIARFFGDGMNILGWHDYYGMARFFGDGMNIFEDMLRKNENKKEC
jgi:hypothetical protein